MGAGGGCGLWRGAGPQCAALCRLAAAFFELFGEIRRTRPLVRQLAVPCRAYFSERDELVSVRSAREFADVPQAVVTMLPHSGHAYYEAQEDLPLLQCGFRAMLQECEKKR